MNLNFALHLQLCGDQSLLKEICQQSCASTAVLGQARLLLEERCLCPSSSPVLLSEISQTNKRAWKFRPLALWLPKKCQSYLIISLPTPVRARTGGLALFSCRFLYLCCLMLNCEWKTVKLGPFTEGARH